MLKKYLKDKEKLINKLLSEYISIKDGYEKIIYESMTYSLMAGGKRLRPILMLLGNQLVNGKEEIVYPFAVAIEMIHTYSLIHDDLPAMDDDNYRRGKLTNHKVYGEAFAILAGDALLNYAFEIMIEESLKDDENKNKLKAASTIAKAAGVKGMIAGQVVDMLSEQGYRNNDILKFIHLNKTSKLIEASLVSGALLGNANKKEIERLSRIGKNIGLAFQIRDDILDIEGNPNKIGKDINKDSAHNKLTYVNSFGLEKAKNYIADLTNESIDLIIGYNKEASYMLKELILYLTDRNY